ncbi:MAG: MarR family transcriptional regulator [Candidatus Lokiarchaeota archaeon]
MCAVQCAVFSSFQQLGALLQIHRKGFCNVSHIGVNLGITSAAASQLLDRMVQQELIRRSENPNDRRAKQLVLTENGIEILRKGFQASQKWLEELVNTLTTDEQKQVVTILTRLIEEAKAIINQPNSKEKI